jgi:antitoxin (DNA-binding transcriptional repressor) of toxin-antitoxin stability system
MADEVSIEELRANLDAILRRVAGGEELTVTIDGVAFASLKAPPPQTWVPKERYLPMLLNRPVDPEFFKLLDELEPEGADDLGDRLKRFYGDDL